MCPKDPGEYPDDRGRCRWHSPFTSLSVIRNLVGPATASLCNLGSKDNGQPSKRPPGGLYLKNQLFSLLLRSEPEQSNLGFTLVMRVWLSVPERANF